MSLDGAHHDNEPTVYDESAFDDYVGTPWLTGVIFFASAVGTFVGAWTVIILFGAAPPGARGLVAADPHPRRRPRDQPRAARRPSPQAPGPGDRGAAPRAPLMLTRSRRHPAGDFSLRRRATLGDGHDDHGTVGVLQQRVRHAAQQQRAEPAQATRPDDDRAGVDPIGLGEQRVSHGVVPSDGAAGGLEPVGPGQCRTLLGCPLGVGAAGVVDLLAVLGGHQRAGRRIAGDQVDVGLPDGHDDRGLAGRRARRRARRRPWRHRSRRRR